MSAFDLRVNAAVERLVYPALALVLRHRAPDVWAQQQAEAGSAIVRLREIEMSRGSLGLQPAHDRAGSENHGCPAMATSPGPHIFGLLKLLLILQCLSRIYAFARPGRRKGLTSCLICAGCSCSSPRPVAGFGGSSTG
jgi:hypothetical protein